MKWLRFKTWDSAAGRHVNVEGEYEPFPDLAFSTRFLTASAVRRHPAHGITVMRVGDDIPRLFRWGAWHSQTNLDAGWLPVDPDHGEWMGPQGPEFVGPRRFRIWFSPARVPLYKPVKPKR